MYAGWFTLAVVLVVLILAVLVFFIARNKKKNVHPDYFGFLIMGLIWMILSLPLENFALLGIGLVFSLIGMVNRKHWKAHRQKWNELNEKDKTQRINLIAFFTFLVILGVILLIMMKGN